MCIAIVKPKNAKISDEYLGNCFDHNRDGAGIAYAHNDKLYVYKGIFDKQKFIDAVRKAEKISQGAMLIHCRIGTHGLRDKNNCHPHVINNRCVLIHNGVLNVEVPENSDESDTICFIKQYLKPLARDFMKDDAICELIEMAIKSNNKFALLNNKGEYRILNEKSGHWENGIWYSNYSYQTPAYSCSVPSVKYINTYKDNKSWKDYPLFNQQPVIDDEKVVNNIKALSNFEILELGEYPVLDLVTLKLVPEADDKVGDTSRYRYLDDVSEEAYEEYCYEVELRGLVNEITGQEEESETELKNAG